MKKFKFSLEKVLSLREFEQNQAQIELGKAQSVVNDLNNQLKYIASEIVRSNESRSTSTELNFLLSIENYVNGLNYKKEILLEELAKAQLVLEINATHPIAEKLKNLYNDDKDTLNKYAKLLYGEACLISGASIDDPVEHSNLVCELMV